MNRLYVVRHGIAVPHGSPEYAEDERPLTPEGRKKMRRVARGLGRLGVEVERIVTSPLPRARQTAEIVAETLDATDLLEDADALRASTSAATIRDWLNARQESSLMVVGHNPSLSDLIGLLLTGKDGPPLVELRKGGVAAFSGRPGTPLLLDWVARPRLLSRLR